MVHVPAAPWMTESEIQLFARWLPFGCIALEFGVGGSTRFFLKMGGLSLPLLKVTGPGGKAFLRTHFWPFLLKMGG